MLILMIALFSSALVIYSTYSQNTHQEINYEVQKIQEKLILTKRTQANTITNVTITNTGTIQIEIRALYQSIDGQTTFLCDPSQPPLSLDTCITPADSLLIDVRSFGVPANATIIAATERGTRTIEYFPMGFNGTTNELYNYDPTKLFIGPLMLKFDDFWYHKALSDGTLDQSQPWRPGWNVNEKLPVTVAWNITVMNIDNRTITLNSLSSFNLVIVGSPTSLPWYIQPLNQADYTQTLQTNQTAKLTFIWDTPLPTNKAQKLTSTGTAMVFLTFFGVYHEYNGKFTAYAQTIPFEAAVTVGKPK